MSVVSKLVQKIGYILSVSFLIFSSTSASAVILSSVPEGGRDDFNALVIEAAGMPDVGVVFMHGRTSQPNGPVVEQLRQALVSAGYTTLSIENPVAFNDYDSNGNYRDFSDYEKDIAANINNDGEYAFPEAYARIRTAINYLKDLGIQKVILAGFSMGSRFTAAHVARGQIDELPIVGYVGVGMYATTSSATPANYAGITPINPANTLPDITVPVLDLYGDDDTNAANTAAIRQTSYGGDMVNYTVEVLDCDASLATNQCHQLVGLKSSNGQSCEALESAVIDWVTNTVPLATPQGKGVCETSVATGTGSGNPDDNGGGGSWDFIAFLILLIPRLRRWILRAERALA